MKKICLIFVMILCLPFALSFGEGNSFALQEEVFSYGKSLQGGEKTLYAQLQKMKDEGIFERGEEVKVENKDILALAKEYARGGESLIKNFNNALKCFSFDNPDIFFVDFDKLEINVLSHKGDYEVIIGSGGEKGYLYEDFEGDLSQDITLFNDRINSLTQRVRGDSIYQSIKKLNGILTSEIEIVFEWDTKFSRICDTAFGCLINSRATDKGVSKLFKCVLDKLGIENALVSGYSIYDNAYQSAMWNYVKCDVWSGVDETLNAKSVNKESCLFADEKQMRTSHIENCYALSKGYLAFPDLVTYERRGQDGKFIIIKEIKNDKTEFTISYDGLGLDKLIQKGYYLAMRQGVDNFLGQSDWVSLKYLQMSGQDCKIYDNKTVVRVDDVTSCDEYDFCLLSVSPDIMGEGGAKGFSCLREENIVASSSPLENLNNDSDYIYSPKLISTSYGKKDVLENKTQTITLNFDKKLKIYDKNASGVMGEKVWINLSSDDERINGEISTYAKVQNVVFDEMNSISFDFTPSPLLRHNYVTYQFEICNIVSSEQLGEGREILPISITFAQDVTLSGYNNLEGVNLVHGSTSSALAGGKDINLVRFSSDLSDVDKDRITERLGREVVHTKTYKLDLYAGGERVDLDGGQVDLKIKYDYLGDYQIFLAYYEKNNSNGNIEKIKFFPCMRVGGNIVTSVDKMGEFLLMFCSGQEEKKTLFIDCDMMGGEVLQPTSALVQINEDFVLSLYPCEGYEIQFILLNGQKIGVENNSVLLKQEELKEENVLYVRFISSASKEKLKNSEEENYLKSKENYTSQNSENNQFTIFLIIIFFALAGMGFYMFYKNNKSDNLEKNIKNNKNN